MKRVNHLISKMVYRILTKLDFKKQRVSTLIATDVAARGLDISHIRTVVNYDAGLYLICMITILFKLIVIN